MGITEIEMLGGISEGTSVHMSRTLMISELIELFKSTERDSTLEDYHSAIVDNNCLQKNTVRTRKITYSNLKLLYALDPENNLFRLLRILYDKAPDELPQLAFLCGYCRDYILREADIYLQNISTGTKLPSDYFVNFISEKFPGRYSDASMHSMSRNLLASFYKTGHVGGNSTNKARVLAKPGAAAVTFAATIAYAMGERGLFLADNEYTRALDCTKEEALSLLVDADAKGYIRLRLLGEVMDVQFTYAEGIV